MKNFAFLILFISFFSFSQNKYTSFELIEKSENNYATNINNSIVKNVEVANIGPSVMSGRVTDLEVNPENPTVLSPLFVPKWKDLKAAARPWTGLDLDLLNRDPKNYLVALPLHNHLVH